VGCFWISFYWKHLVVLSFLAPMRVALAANVCLEGGSLHSRHPARDVQRFDCLRQGIRAISKMPASSVLIAPPFWDDLVAVIKSKKDHGYKALFDTISDKKSDTDELSL
jgi:hypothetical protein